MFDENAGVDTTVFERAIAKRERAGNTGEAVQQYLIDINGELSKLPKHVEIQMIGRYLTLDETTQEEISFFDSLNNRFCHSFAAGSKVGILRVGDFQKTISGSFLNLAASSSFRIRDRSLYFLCLTTVHGDYLLCAEHSGDPIEELQFDVAVELPNGLRGTNEIVIAKMERYMLLCTHEGFGDGLKKGHFKSEYKAYQKLLRKIPFIPVR